MGAGWFTYMLWFVLFGGVQLGECRWGGGNLGQVLMPEPC
jgi:hypothetical protein